MKDTRASRGKKGVSSWFQSQENFVIFFFPCLGTSIFKVTTAWRVVNSRNLETWWKVVQRGKVDLLKLVQASNPAWSQNWKQHSQGRKTPGRSLLAELAIQLLRSVPHLIITSLFIRFWTFSRVHLVVEVGGLEVFEQSLFSSRGSSKN